MGDWGRRSGAPACRGAEVHFECSVIAAHGGLCPDAEAIRRQADVDHDVIAQRELAHPAS